MIRHILIFLRSAALGVLISAAAAAIFLALTSWGGGIVSARLLKDYLKADTFTYERAAGNVVSGVTLYGAEAKGAKKWKWLPPGAGARAKRVDLELTSFNFLDGLRIKIIDGEVLVNGVKKSDITGSFSDYIWRLSLKNATVDSILTGFVASADSFNVKINTKVSGDIEFDVTGGKVTAPGGDTAEFSGMYSPGAVDLNVSAARVIADDIRALPVVNKKALEGFSGELRDVKVCAKGRGEKDNITGSLSAVDLRHRDAVLARAPVEFAIELKKSPETIELTGNAVAKKAAAGYKGHKFHLEKADVSFYAHYGANGFVPRISGKVSGIVFDKIRILPEGTVVKAQTVNFSVDTADVKKVDVEMFNGIIKMPVSDTVICSGTYRSGTLDINLYSKKIDLSEIFYFFRDNDPYLRNIRGTLEDIDVNIRGTADELLFAGGSRISELSRDDVELSGSDMLFSMIVRDPGKSPLIVGDIGLEGGDLVAKKIPVSVGSGKITFNGPPGKFTYNFSGTSMADEVKINIKAWGSKERPEFELTSAPPMPKDRLLLMLFTQKSWTAADEAVGQGKAAEGVSKDLVGYLFSLGGEGGIAKGVGIKDVSVQYDEEKQGVNARSAISGNVDITYGVGQRKDPVSNATATKYTVGSEYKINENLSVGAEKEIDQQEFSKDSSKSGVEDEKKVYVKIKQDF
jgi:hypothetical protein